MLEFELAAVPRSVRVILERHLAIGLGDGPFVGVRKHIKNTTEELQRQIHNDESDVVRSKESGRRVVLCDLFL